MAAPAPEGISFAPDGAIVLCDVESAAADLATIDVLARLQLEAKRRGQRLRLRNVPPGLRELIAFAGLEDVLDG